MTKDGRPRFLWLVALPSKPLELKALGRAFADSAPRAGGDDLRGGRSSDTLYIINRGVWEQSGTASGTPRTPISPAEIFFGDVEGFDGTPRKYLVARISPSASNVSTAKILRELTRRRSIVLSLSQRTTRLPARAGERSCAGPESLAWS